MLVFGAGDEIAGTVGGGKVEAKMIDEAAKSLGTPGSRVFRFVLGKTPEDEDGICGGVVEYLIETFDKTALPLFRELSAIVGRNEGGVLVSLLAPGGPPRKINLANAEQIGRVCTAHQQPLDAKGCGVQCTPYQFSEDAVAAVKELAATGNPGIRVSAGGVEAFVEPLAQAPTVILCGAGHLSYYIARYAKSVHFRVVVYDERDEYANHERFPEADTVIAADFEGIFDRVHIDEGSYVVIVTRGHQRDQIVLEQAVRTKARYIGMIGSRQKTRLLLQKLKDKGIPSALLDRVYSPIGLAIGAVTPQEIALSIVCELVKIRRLGDEPGTGHMSLSRQEGSS